MYLKKQKQPQTLLWPTGILLFVQFWF